jgi:signal transduction histidine kinase
MSKIKLGALRESASSEGFRGALDDVRDLVEQSIQATRSLTSELSPPVLYELGFAAALDWLVEQARERLGVSVELEGNVPAMRLDEDIRLFLFLSVRELLVNVAKHAHAREARVSVRKSKDRVRITIEDDGVGFNIHEFGLPGNSPEAFGLFSIRERLKYVGGQLLLASRPGKGTRATLVAPLRRDRGTQEDEPCEREDSTG